MSLGRLLSSFLALTARLSGRRPNAALGFMPHLPSHFLGLSPGKALPRSRPRRPGEITASRLPPRPILSAVSQSCRTVYFYSTMVNSSCWHLNCSNSPIRQSVDCWHYSLGVRFVRGTRVSGGSAPR